MNKVAKNSRLLVSLADRPGPNHPCQSLKPTGAKTPLNRQQATPKCVPIDESPVEVEVEKVVETTPLAMAKLSCQFSRGEIR